MLEANAPSSRPVQPKVKSLNSCSPNSTNVLRVFSFGRIAASTIGCFATNTEDFPPTSNRYPIEFNRTSSDTHKPFAGVSEPSAMSLICGDSDCAQQFAGADPGALAAAFSSVFGDALAARSGFPPNAAPSFPDFDDDFDKPDWYDDHDLSDFGD